MRWPGRARSGAAGTAASIRRPTRRAPRQSARRTPWSPPAGSARRSRNRAGRRTASSDGCQRTARAGCGQNPMLPSMVPRARPVGISRTTTRHQSRSASSFSAIARMISDVDCDPELPPDEMISGMNSASTAARSISCSKCPIAWAVSVSPTKRIASQPRALAEHFQRRRSAGTARRSPPCRRVSARPRSVPTPARR